MFNDRKDLVSRCSIGQAGTLAIEAARKTLEYVLRKELPAKARGGPYTITLIRQAIGSTKQILSRDIEMVSVQIKIDCAGVDHFDKVHELVGWFSLDKADIMGNKSPYPWNVTRGLQDHYVKIDRGPSLKIVFNRNCHISPELERANPVNVLPPEIDFSRLS